MPVEPVTPPDSAVWRVVHFPVMLGVVAAGLFLAAVLAIQLLGIGFQAVGYVPGARYLVPLIAAAAIIAIYWIFARVVERRPAIEEFGTGGWLRESAIGVGAGFGLALATFAILYLLGAVRVLGVNPPQVLALPLVAQLCTAIVLEILLRGLAFRLGERLLGSWLALFLTVVGFAVAAPFFDATTPPAVLAFILQTGLIGAALYMVTRRLWAAIGLHAAWAFAQVALYGFVTDTDHYGLLVTRVAGSDALTGGRAGTAASLPALIVTALAVAIVLTTAIRRGRIVRPLWRRGRTR